MLSVLNIRNVYRNVCHEAALGEEEVESANVVQIVFFLDIYISNRHLIYT